MDYVDDLRLTASTPQTFIHYLMLILPHKVMH